MKNNHRKFGFTLIELLITVSLMVVIGSFTTASLISSARTQNTIKNTKDVQSQVDRVVEKIEVELKEATNVQTIQTKRKDVNYSESIINDFVSGANGYDKSPNSILIYNYNNHDEDGNISVKDRLKIICLRQDNYKGEVIGQRLVQYTLPPTFSIPKNIPPGQEPECSDAYIGTLFSPNSIKTFLTDSAIQLNYFRATPLVMNTTDPNRILDVNPDALDLEISAIYNNQNSNVKRLGERVQSQSSKQSLYTLKKTLLTK